MTKSKRLLPEVPLADSFETEKLIRSNYRGRYEVNYVCPYTGDELHEVRSTRLEYLNPVPVEVPVYLRRPESTDDRIRRLMNEQREYIAWQQRHDESEDDERDFDDENGDPDLPHSPYEFVAEASANIQRQERIRRYKEARAKQASKASDDDPDASKPAAPTPPADKKLPVKEGSDADSPSAKPAS